MAEVHVVFGSLGSGKTTYARQLADRQGAIRFSKTNCCTRFTGPDIREPLSLPWVAESEGARVKLHFVTASREVREQRVLARNAVRGYLDHCGIHSAPVHGIREAATAL